jgi:hypothetical protein
MRGLIFFVGLLIAVQLTFSLFAIVVGSTREMRCFTKYMNGILIFQGFDNSHLLADRCAGVATGDFHNCDDLL